jgi:hypothetical protein
MYEAGWPANMIAGDINIQLYNNFTSKACAGLEQT